MTTLLEYKEKIRAFYAKNEVYIRPAWKFIVALLVYMQINSSLGFNTKINSIPVTLVLSLMGAIIPVGGTILIAAIVILLHLYTLTMEAAVMGLILFLIMYFLFFRFAPKSGINILLMPVCLKLHIGGVVPVASGLLSEWYSAASVVCGTIVYYFLLGIKENSSMLGAESDEGITYKFTAIMNQLMGNKEMYLTVVTFALTTLIVYTIRKLSVNYAWHIAIVTGLLVNFIISLAGNLILGIDVNIIWLLVGTLVAGGVAFVIQFMAYNVDFTRVERVQFEDDDYYYYVKAIPKIYVTGKEKQVKTISTKNKRRRSEFDEEQIRRQMNADKE